MQTPAFLDVSVAAVPTGVPPFLDSNAVMHTEGLEKLWGPLQERHRELQRASDETDSGDTRVVTAGAVVPVDLESGLLPGGVVDGQTLSKETIILLVAQRDPTENGLWLPGTPPVRHPSAAPMKKGDWVFVCAGLTLAGTAFMCTNRRYNGVLEFRPVFARPALRDATEERAFVTRLGVGAACLNPPSRPEDEHANRTYLRLLFGNPSAASRYVWFDFGNQSDMITDASGLIGWKARSSPLFEDARITIVKGWQADTSKWETASPTGITLDVYRNWYLNLTSKFPNTPVNGMVVFTALDLFNPVPTYSSKSDVVVGMSTLKTSCIVSMNASLRYVRLRRGQNPPLMHTLPLLNGPAQMFTISWRITSGEIQMTVYYGPRGEPRTAWHGSMQTTGPYESTTSLVYSIIGTYVRIHELRLCHSTMDETTWNRIVTESDGRWLAA